MAAPCALGSVPFMDRAARGLMALQFALLGGVLLACGAAALLSGASPLAQTAAMVAFGAWFTAGMVRYRRTMAEGAPPDARVGVWLLGLTVLWLILVAISPANAWIAFNLWLLGGLVLSLRWAIPYAAVTLLTVMAAQASAPGSLSPGELIGPIVGATCAIAVSRGHRRLVREAIARQSLLDALMRAQLETSELQAQMAALQRQAGVLAERTRLSRDIHDTLAQGFASILLTIRAAAPPEKAKDLPAILARIETLAGEGLDESRRVVADLAPPQLAEVGVVSSLRRIVETHGSDGGLQTCFAVEGDLAQLPTPVEVTLLRTAQCALTNIRRHARATRVGMSLVRCADAVRLDIVDDGIGFEPSEVTGQATAGGGYGLRSTQSRLRELGGDLEIESARGRGTTLTAVVPIDGIIA